MVTLNILRMRLSLNLNEHIEAYTFENRRLLIQCQKHEKSEKLIVDILPRIRYMLKINTSFNFNANFILSDFFLKHGVIIMPHLSRFDDTMSDKIVVLNMSETNLRLYHDQNLLESSPRSQSEYDEDNGSQNLKDR